MLAFQKDGALVASGDFAGVGAVWDLRCGKKVAKKHESKTRDPLRAYWRRFFFAYSDYSFQLPQLHLFIFLIPTQLFVLTVSPDRYFSNGLTSSFLSPAPFLLAPIGRCTP